MTNGASVAGPITNLATPVSNGLFLASIDFGNVFNGSNYWLDIAVRSNGQPTFVELTPRQAISATPYSLMAQSANNLTGSLPATQLSGTISTAQLPAAVLTNGQTGALYVNSINRGALTITSNSPADVGNLNLPYNSSIVFASGNISDEQNHGPAVGQMELAINAIDRLETSWERRPRKQCATNRNIVSWRRAGPGQPRLLDRRQLVRHQRQQFSRLRDNGGKSCALYHRQRHREMPFWVIAARRRRLTACLH